VSSAETSERTAGERAEQELRTPAGLRRIVACFDGSEFGERVLPHALAMAKGLGAPLSLLRVLEGGGPGAAPLDPLDWNLHREEARSYLEGLVEPDERAGGAIEAEVIEGPAAEQICLWARHHDVDLTVLCTHGVSGQTEWSLASTARKLVDRVPGSILLVPATAAPGERIARYRRILVPLDGSARAESVLPLAARLAAAHDAELLLAHVVPAPELTEIGPLDAEDLELRERLLRRNERVANEYLDRLRARLAASDLSLRVLVLRGGDARSRLARLIADEAVDLVILSAHGRSGHSDVPLGSVTAYLITHAATPTLVVRSRSDSARRVAAKAVQGVRLPSQATP